MNWIRNPWVIVLVVLAVGTVGAGYVMRDALNRMVWAPLCFKLDSLINYFHAGRHGIDIE